MTLPNNQLAPDGPIGVWLQPDNTARIDPLVDYELGGIGISDPSQGLQIQNWRVRVDGNQNILVSPEPYTVETFIITGAAITEISLAFDQNMRPVIAFLDNGQAKLYWYNPDTGSVVTISIMPGIVSAMVTMDDKRKAATELATNDVLVYYIRDGNLYYRQQRERYATERMLAVLKSPLGKLRKLGMAENWRVQVQVAY